MVNTKSQSPKNKNALEEMQTFENLADSFSVQLHPAHIESP